MTYLSSSIIKQPNGLFKASIFSTYYYFGVSEEHDTFITPSEAKAWLLKKRCTNLEEKLSLEPEKPKDKKDSKKE